MFEASAIVVVIAAAAVSGPAAAGPAFVLVRISTFRSGDPHLLLPFVLPCICLALYTMLIRRALAALGVPAWGYRHIRGGSRQPEGVVIAL